MREIKYQAWDKASKTMILDYAHLRSNGELWVTQFHERMDSPDLVLRQYTGLKDKNGVEIYEDDLLKSGRTGLLYHVFWDDDKSAFTSLCVDPKRDFRMEPYSWGDAEKVGNIHENPELLNEG